MRSLRSLAPRAWWVRAGRGLAAVAVVAVSALAVPSARAGGLLVSDGSQVFRYQRVK